MMTIIKLSTRLGMLSDLVCLERQKINEGTRVSMTFMRKLEAELLELQRAASGLEDQLPGRK